MSRDKANEILSRYEDDNEYHFHQVDREWIIDAMIEYSRLNQQEISDEEIEVAIDKNLLSNPQYIGYKVSEKEKSAFIGGVRGGCYWYRETLKQRKGD